MGAAAASEAQRRKERREAARAEASEWGMGWLLEESVGGEGIAEFTIWANGRRESWDFRGDWHYCNAKVAKDHTIA
jgi:hypothetical protein